MFFESINSFLWMVLFLPLFSIAGVLTGYFSLHRSRRKTEETTAVVKSKRLTADGKQLLPVQAASTVLAATVGIGNIVGTSQAIAMGGPGAVFWMWIAGLLGFAVKYAEIRFGLRNNQGAIDYIEAALGKTSCFFYSAAALASTLLVSNMAQMNATFSAFSGLIPLKNGNNRLLLAVGLWILLILGLFHGAQTVGKACSVLVPIMAVAYLCAAGKILWNHPSQIPVSFGLIFQKAFQKEAIIGGTGVIGLKEAMLWGLRRGAFSNEAGLGTAANIHAFVRTDHPERHALWGVFEVFADTFLICTITALTILCSGVKIPYGILPGTELISAVLSEVFGEKKAAWMLAVLLSAFGFSTTLGCYVNGLRCAEKLGWGEGCYFLIYGFCAFLGILAPFGGVWRLADTVNVLVAVPNLLGLIIISNKWKPSPRRS